ncbi:hypothetical protein Ancab_012426 [Ancistrocladus abbreviatus]
MARVSHENSKFLFEPETEEVQGKEIWNSKFPTTLYYLQHDLIDAISLQFNEWKTAYQTLDALLLVHLAIAYWFPVLGIKCVPPASVSRILAAGNSQEDRCNVTPWNVNLRCYARKGYTRNLTVEELCY